MNFLQTRSLKELALYLLGGIFLLFVIEFLVIRAKIESLQEVEEKKDFARGAQLDGQQIAYLVQLHLNDDQAGADIYARTQELDHKLRVLGNGGRIDRSELFLKPLPKLPAITFTNLLKHWEAYRNSILEEVNGESVAPLTATDTTSIIASDSSAIPPVHRKEINARTVLPGQWLTLSNWFEKLMVDLAAETQKQKDGVERWFFAFAFLDLVVLASLFYLFEKSVLNPLRTLKANAVTSTQDTSFARNEIGELADEVNEILEQLKDATEFVAAIGEGKLDFDYTGLDKKYSVGKNRLADSLLSMQEKLRTLNEEENRRQWANEGLSKFVDILRSSNDNINTLGDKIISALVKYTNSNQGGLYILNDEDERNRHLELISLFAFDNKKFDRQKVRLGEGILGQTFLEKETTILNEIPDEYIRITSGLGSATPKSLLIVPLKVDKEVYGIVELASFKNFQSHEILFVEKLAETIASTLASVKAAQKNRSLIEQFQQQTEEMRAQEEEMRQNMEELQATQEELSRKEQDYIVRIRELEQEGQQGIPPVEHQKLKEELGKQIVDHQARIRDLERKLSEKPQREDDWALAIEVEKDLRQQLEALRITQDVLSNKQKG
jgi:GAF domain-containing protein